MSQYLLNKLSPIILNYNGYTQCFDKGIDRHTGIIDQLDYQLLVQIEIIVCIYV